MWCMQPESRQHGIVQTMFSQFRTAGFGQYYTRTMIDHTHPWTEPSRRRIACHLWVRWWAYSPILEVQILEQLSHGSTPTWLPGCTPYLRAARLRSRVATRVSSNFSIAWWHFVRQDDRFSAALFSRFGLIPHRLRLILRVSLYRLTGPPGSRVPDSSCP